MKVYKKTADIGRDYHGLPHETAVELVYNVFVTETEYASDKNACVILLDGAAELKEVFNLFPFLPNMDAEIDEVTACMNTERYHKRVYILSDDGAGIVLFWRVANDV